MQAVAEILIAQMERLGLAEGHVEEMENGLRDMLREAGPQHWGSCWKGAMRETTGASGCPVRVRGNNVFCFAGRRKL